MLSNRNSLHMRQAVTNAILGGCDTGQVFGNVLEQCADYGFEVPVPEAVFEAIADKYDKRDQFRADQGDLQCNLDPEVIYLSTRDEAVN